MFFHRLRVPTTFTMHTFLGLRDSSFSSSARDRVRLGSVERAPGPVSRLRDSQDSNFTVHGAWMGTPAPSTGQHEFPLQTLLQSQGKQGGLRKCPGPEASGTGEDPAQPTHGKPAPQSLELE